MTRILVTFLLLSMTGCLSLRQQTAVRVPQPIGYGLTDAHAWLLLEWLELDPTKTTASKQLGYELAELHRASAAAYGWQRDNVIGATPQCNNEHASWVEFWCEERLRPQLTRAGLLDDGERLLAKVAQFFVDYTPQPSLLHGDLWGGNWGALTDGSPVIFDPAVYYGDRETDIAMTSLFGGFDDAFYSAYNEAWPLDEGYASRRDLYNLYHVLNHYNLFGGGYRAQAMSMIEQLAAN